MKKTVEVICVSSAFEHLHIRGKDSAGVPLNHKPGQNFYLVEGQTVTGKEKAALLAACPGIEISRTVPASLKQEVDKTPKLNGTTVVLTAIALSIEVSAAEEPKAPVEETDPLKMNYEQLKAALKAKSLPTDGKTEELRARLVEATKPATA